VSGSSLSDLPIFANSEVLYALVKAEVVEQLREQPKCLPELAQACNLDAGVLYRTLRFAGVIGAVTQPSSCPRPI
jgi:hypothetical protein